MRIVHNSQKRKLILFCPSDWLHSHDVQGVYTFIVMYIGSGTNFEQSLIGERERERERESKE